MKKITKFLLSFSLLYLFTHALSAQTPPKWLRYPSISPDGKTIVFTYKGDLWKVGQLHEVVS